MYEEGGYTLGLLRPHMQGIAGRGALRRMKHEVYETKAAHQQKATRSSDPSSVPRWPAVLPHNRPRGQSLQVAAPVA